MPGRILALVTTGSLIVLAVVVLGCAAIGFTTTQSDDGRSEAARQAALENALIELQPALNGGDHVDAGELASIGRRAGLDDLRFDADLTADSGREVQTMQDAQGRIVGWFSWAPDRSLCPRHGSIVDRGRGRGRRSGVLRHAGAARDAAACCGARAQHGAGARIDDAGC